MVAVIDDQNQTIDLRGLKPYELRWGAESRFREVYEYQILMPETPPDEDCINYGMPEEDQIFRKTFIPPQVLYPYAQHDDPWTEEQIEHFVAQEYQRRHNGVWIFLKGDKYWIPGPFYIFLNYWKLLSLQPVRFIFTALELWWIWIDTVRDPNWDGLADFKCRQIGDTEFVVFMIWEYASRVSGVKNCMQSALGDEHVAKSYERLVYGHKEMIWYMKPINRGTDTPAQGLEFKYPTEVITTNKLKAQRDNQQDAKLQGANHFEYPELNSEILFGPYKERHFDGGTYGRAYLDEFGKATLFDPAKIVRVLQPAINSRILDKQVGKIILTSTVEEMKGGKSLLWSKKIWAQCKPVMKATGMTSLNRLRRIFRGALDRAPVDRWGFAQKEAERARILEKTKEYLESGDMIGMLEHQRANPLTIMEVFISANDESQFDIDKLERRRQYLNSEFYINPKTGTNVKPWVRGNLRWKDDDPESGEAVWEPNSTGRWMISAHPKDHGLKENATIQGVFKSKPGNSHYYRCGIDPYEQKKLVTEDWSLGGIAVKRVLDDRIDGSEDRYYQFTDESRGIKAGDPVDGGINFLTNRYCCCYLYRHPDPEDFYEDCILTFLYYGTEFLPEKNKANGLLKHVEDRGYDMYKMDGVQLSKNAKGKSEEDGVTATEKTIDEYFSHLMTLSCKWANTIDLPWILDQMLTMNWANRGQKDLGVAVGWCEYACKVPIHYKKKTAEMKASIYFEEQLV